tara:strand:- start:1205 stop:1444 length:240 start_codon:yes stop_codon:yes gene_type:complete
MYIFFLVIYLVSFCLIAGGAFALVYANITSINQQMDRPRPRRHPEAPEPGEEVMYVDVSNDTAAEFAARKQQLEDLYNE